MEPPSSVSVHVSNQSHRLRLPRVKLERAIQYTLRSLGGGFVSLVLVDDAQIHELNARFRAKDAPTDVLTFPGPSFPGAPIGDIAISVDTAAAQAKLRGVSLTNELSMLAIHGALHLLGMDDQTEEDCAHMQQAMHVIASELGLDSKGSWTSLAQEAP